MDTQLDYEARIWMAVLPSAPSADVAGGALREAGIASTQAPLPAGRYLLADPRLGRYTRAIIATGGKIRAILGQSGAIGVQV